MFTMETYAHAVVYGLPFLSVVTLISIGVCHKWDRIRGRA